MESKTTEKMHFIWVLMHLAGKSLVIQVTQGPAACKAKEVPSFLRVTLSNGPAPGTEPATSRSAVWGVLPTELILPRSKCNKLRTLHWVSQ